MASLKIVRQGHSGLFSILVTSLLLLPSIHLAGGLPTTSSTVPVSKGLDFEAALSTDAASEDLPESTFQEERRLAMISTTRESALNTITPFGRQGVNFTNFTNILQADFVSYWCMAQNVNHKSLAYLNLKVMNEVKHKYVDEIEVKCLGRNSENFLTIILKVLVTLNLKILII
jgi:hypothetical protein